jgi:signal transduction histidine kinase
MANQYRVNVTQRLAVLTHDAEEALENVPAGKPVAPALAAVLDSLDEGVVLFDARGRRVAAAGMTDTRNASVGTFRGDGTHGGLIQATISNDRISGLLRQLDLGLAVGTLVAMLAGGLIITWISARAMARIQSAYERVHRFTGDAAHELRTPLSVIANNADGLAFHPQDDGARERSLANIREAAWQMRELMDGLLLLARADEAVVQDLHAIDVGACIERAAEIYRPQAAARHLALTVDRRSNVTIYGQPSQVARIIANLIENAMHHTPAGGSILVTGSADRSGAVIEVTDTGVGIPSEALERVFDRFWRAKGAVPGEGSGLGLAIARSLARAHGGDVQVRSEPGKGSTFTVKLSVRPRRNARSSTIS